MTLKDDEAQSNSSQTRCFYSRGTGSGRSCFLVFGFFFLHHQLVSNFINKWLNATCSWAEWVNAIPIINHPASLSVPALFQLYYRATKLASYTVRLLVWTLSLVSKPKSLPGATREEICSYWFSQRDIIWRLACETDTYSNYNLMNSLFKQSCFQLYVSHLHQRNPTVS